MKKMLKSMLLGLVIASPLFLAGCSKSIQSQYADAIKKNAEDNSVNMKIKFDKFQINDTASLDELDIKDDIEINSIKDNEHDTAKFDIKAGDKTYNGIISKNNLYVNADALLPFLYNDLKDSLKEEASLSDEIYNGAITGFMKTFSTEIDKKIAGKYISVSELAGDNDQKTDFSFIFDTNKLSDISSLKEINKDKFSKDGDKITLTLEKDDFDAIIADAYENIDDYKDKEDKENIKEIHSFWEANKDGIKTSTVKTTINTKDNSVNYDVNFDGKVNKQQINIVTTIDQTSKKVDEEVKAPASSKIMDTEDYQNAVTDATQKAFKSMFNFGGSDSSTDEPAKAAA